MNLYDTLTMLEGIRAAKPAPSFLRDTYFPTEAGDIFETEKVIVDYENETNDKLAPAVIKGSVPVQRGSFQSKELTAPLIAPSAELSVDQLNRRMFNESIVSGLSPEQREAGYLADDLAKLDAMITRTEEYMAARVLLDNAYTIKQYLNGYGTSQFQNFSINFFGEGNSTNQAVYTPGGGTWSVTSTTILADIAAMCRMLKKKGLQATDVIMGANAADVFLRNQDVREILDNRRMSLVNDTVNPAEAGVGVAYLGSFNIEGNVVDIYAYDNTYVDENGQDQYYFDANKIAVTAKGMGRTSYGAISQYEEGETVAKTYAAARVPHVIINRHDNLRELVYQARPLAMPKHLNASISAQVL